ncbi:MAG: hypothetical protein WC459_02125 [Patescibacteria group bacterium]
MKDKEILQNIISSFQKKATDQKLRVWLGWISIAFITIWGVFAPLALSIFILSCAVIFIPFGILDIVDLRKTKKLLALWQGFEQEKYWYKSELMKKYTELQRTGFDYNKSQLNTNILRSKVERLQREIENDLLK